LWRDSMNHPWLRESLSGVSVHVLRELRASYVSL
jgi:hypothetical protein